MSNKSISIKNCKSFKNMKIDMEGLNCIIGRNDAGKTNILKTISFYFQSLSSDSLEFHLNDKRNPFAEKSEIEVTFDFSYLISVVEEIRESKCELNFFH